jgi:hypothetical protein
VGNDRTISLGSRNVTVEPFTGRKALRAFKLLRGITQGAPAIMERWAEFTREYEEANTVSLSRAEAMFEFPPGRFDHISDADWQASGNRLKVPRSPGTAEKIAAVFPEALDLAETEVLRLLALVAMPNAEVRENRGNIEDALDALAEEIIDAPYEQLLELAVLGGEAVDEQYRRKAAALGDRMGNALRLVGLDPNRVLNRQPAPTPTSSTERQTSSNGSPTPTGGDPTPPSTPIGASSSASTTD